MSIVLQGITKQYGIHTVVHNISLEIQQGELFVLLGASGSGKSTLLRIIAGLTTAERGRIFLNEREVTHEPPRKRGTGFVFQNYSLFKHMNVAQNIGFGLEIKKVPRKERQRRIAELLDLVGMAGLGERFASQLSGGQQQRVALARALAQNPEVLLLDEPFGALDVKIRSQLRESLKEIQDRLGVTTVLVTHDQEEAFELADRIGLLERGHLLEVGDPESLYHHPRKEFTATFVGGGNVLVGRSVGNQIQLGTVSIPFPKDAPVHDPGAPVRILFRPETLTLSEKKPQAKKSLHVLGKGQVVGQVFAGSAHRIRLEMEGLRGVRPLVPSLRYGQHAAHLDAQVVSSASRKLPAEQGQKLWVSLSRFHVLAPTGLKLLICVDNTKSGKAATAFGLKLAEAAQGPTTMLTVTPHQEKVARVRATLETDTHKQTPSDNVRVTPVVRQGASHTEILSEAQDGIYEIIVLGRGSSRDAERSKLGSTARKVLKQAECPVLLVSSPREQINRMLICTAAGEPGKSVVRFAGRVARRTGAAATVLHVHTPRSIDQAHAERYLRQAQVSLEALGVDTQILMEQGPALAWIIEEADAGDYDLVVIGAPARQTSRRLGWIDLATHIIAATSRPVMVVPMQL